MRRPYIHAGAVIAALTFADAPASAQQRPAPRPNNLFTASGFEVRVANTPDRSAQLRKLPPNKLVTRERDGKTFYVYADPAGHPFCLGWGQPDDETIRRILRDRR